MITMEQRLLFICRRSFLQVRKCSDRAVIGSIELGNLKMNLRKARDPALIPFSPVDRFNQIDLKHLKWMLQKYLLRQDMFLIGPPGPYRRRLVLNFLSLINKEWEYIPLSRDTTENDLKQRREIVDGKAIFIDQTVVKAATLGRILVLEGMEKAERNVLPVLNSLLESREMALEDGRFLVSPRRYNELLKMYGESRLGLGNITKVHEDFIIIALGLPAHKYGGNQLDPPLRSRFQARKIDHYSYEDLLTSLAPKLDDDGDRVLFKQLVAWANQMNSREWGQLQYPDFPSCNLGLISSIMNQVESYAPSELLQLLYPWDIILKYKDRKFIQESLKLFSLDKQKLSNDNVAITGVNLLDGLAGEVTYRLGDDEECITVVTGSRAECPPDESFISLPFHNKLLISFLMSHSVHDFCVVGPKGCGKTSLIKRFADLLHYDTEHIMLYQDLTSRELLQQRNTTEDGTTFWKFSPLVQAAIRGHLVILDGLHQVHRSAISVLHSLVHDRFLQLFDGTRLISDSQFDHAMKETGYTSEKLNEIGIYRIHPSFRIIATSEPPDTAGLKSSWLTAEVLSLFLFHYMRPLTAAEELHILHKKLGDKKVAGIEKVLELTHKLQASADQSVRTLASSLSFRQVLRMAKKLQQYPEVDLYQMVQQAALSKYLPAVAKTAFMEAVDDVGLVPNPSLHESQPISWSRTGDMLTIGKTSCRVQQTSDMTKVPKPLFFDNDQHLQRLEDLLRDITLNENILVIGNQGVGKNKIVDRLLELLDLPREYIQLHRDTTVNSLTLVPTIENGRLIFKDSPLVKAIKEGNVLVVDEADKAPTQVTFIFKSLLENCEMLLGDGRRIVPPGQKSTENVISAHPRFRMIFLANRPGFPFLGNNFFASLGDVFACHVIDNPDELSEIKLLSQFGPDVDESIIQLVVNVFRDLRAMVDSGDMSYPYSTREAVAIIKHMQAYPEDGLKAAIKNVLDFDQFSSETMTSLLRVLSNHGVPYEATIDHINLGKIVRLESMRACLQWDKFPLVMREDITTCPVSFSLEGEARYDTFDLDGQQARADQFSEQLKSWQLMVSKYLHFQDMIVTFGKTDKDPPAVMHALTSSPFGLFSAALDDDNGRYFNLYMLDTMQCTEKECQMFPLTGAFSSHVLFHNLKENALVLLNHVTGEANSIHTGTIVDRTRTHFTKKLFGEGGLHGSAVFENKIFVYRANGLESQVIDLDNRVCANLTLPEELKSLKNVHPIRDNVWLLCSDERKVLLHLADDFCSASYHFLGSSGYPANIDTVYPHLPVINLERYLPSIVPGDTRVVTSAFLDRSPVYILDHLNFEQGKVNVYDFPRTPDMIDIRNANSPVYLENGSLIVRSVTGKFKNEKNDRAYLEIIDLSRQTARYIDLKCSKAPFLAKWVGEKVITVSEDGDVKLWQVTWPELSKSLKYWKKLVGTGDDGSPLNIRKSGMDVSSPKHGRIDPTGSPHVGGNTWAGGSGGRDTAGLGGKGGPYRLDGGHPVFQVPDEEKAAVPPEVLAAARELAQKTLKERLNEIKMSEYDDAIYQSFSKDIQTEVGRLRGTLEGLQAKNKERQWMRHQMDGELDESKLVEGLTGEKNVYKRRMEQLPEAGSQAEKRKRICLLVDMSGSMYRFNGYDGRLHRQMEAMIMIMEALQGFETRYSYEIYGHSGETSTHALVSSERVPSNKKERLETILNVQAHSQFCLSGDNTIEAIDYNIDRLASSKSEYDETFLIVMSDANLNRYGIPATRLAKILLKNEDIKSSIVFIGSLGDQAERLKRDIPPGHAFVCFDTRTLPHVLSKLFTSVMLD